MKCLLNISILVLASLALQAQSNFEAFRFMESHSLHQAKLAISQLEDDSLKAVSKKQLKLWAVEHLQNEVMLKHTHSLVDNSTPWTETRLGVKLKNGDHTSVISVAQAQRFQQSGNQMDMDHYWEASNSFYFNGNFNLGSNNLFPVWGAGAGVYFTGIKKTELGLGYRYSKFSNTAVQMRIASLTYYPKGMYINVKYFNVKSGNGISHAVMGEARSYLHNGFGYLLLRVAAGTEVDRLANAAGALTSNSIGAGINYRLSPRWSAELTLSAEQQAISENLSRNLTTLNLSLNYHFAK